MKASNPLNIIVTGVGGQGVVSLSETLWKFCEVMDWPCQGSIFKGGAQQHGSVVSFLRVFTGQNPDYRCYSSQIPDGELDLIFGLEPWETLRQIRYFGSRTRLIVNSRIAAFPTERFGTRSPVDPIAELNQLALPLVLSDFTDTATRSYGEARMANYMLVAQGIDAKLVPFDKRTFTQAYLQTVKLKPELIKRLTEGTHGKNLEERS